ncbi:unnamed protein product [Rotaria magnacalcarata]|uniref:Reverse transcriptase domain-containing protein n=1 Tax=Rotaria magnacalcarata TaxID=392030 RepID=A0A819AK17_9BILA|nr:unnamed protein product [Rotaria magnacalcarata]CAF3803731.1 unnamed protein product [Rotaria magnacalcarata]
MPNNMHDSAMMICYRECLSNLSKFNDGEEYKIFQFISKIERVGKMIDANENILHCMCTAKLDGEARRWYDDNMSLTQCVQQRSLPRIHHIPSQHRSFNLQSQSSTSRRNIQHIPTEHAASNNSPTMNIRQYGPCSICQRNNHRTIDCYYKKPFGCYQSGTRDGGHSSKLKQHPSTNYNTTLKFSSPIFINVQVNVKRQHAIIDTGSAVTIINQQLLKNIHHKKFMYKYKSHKSANSTSINIIGEIQLEIKIQGHMILILADATTNLITNLLLGNDWITENNVIIDSPQRHIFLTDKYYQIIGATPFTKPPDLHLPILLIDEITLPPYSEKLINVKTTSPIKNIIDVLFEPAHNLYSKQILLTNAIFKMENNRSQIMIINKCENKSRNSRNTSKTKQRQQLQNILWKYGKLFDLRQPFTIKATVHNAIETGTHPPTYTSPYRVSYKDEQIQRDEIDKLLKQGIIEESISPWSPPIVLDAFPMPRIYDIFDHLSQAEYYTTIDFKSGYFQVGLDPKDRPKTAFSTRDQHYQFTVLPQGVTNGPPAFQLIVSQILGSTRWQYSLASLDDVIIYSTTFNQHLHHLNDILNRLNDANFCLNINKCQIAQTAIDYLGHHIEHSNIRPNADNIRALIETQQPTTAKEAVRFVKATEYHRKFIPAFSTIAQPLHQYAPRTKEQRSKKSQATPITLSDDALDAFNKLKKILTNDLILRIPDKNLPFKIQTDASKIGIEAVLMQTH